MLDSVLAIITAIVKNPWIACLLLFLLIASAAGYGYWEQNKRYIAISQEVGMLRAELKKTNEIIKLKVELVRATAARCN